MAVTAARPNILLLLSDQHRADVLGAAGHPVVQTPNLDDLAAVGALFESAYCQGPLCVPARASLLTGRYVRDHGVPNNTSRLAGGLHTVVEAIKDVGYHTAAIGDMHLYPYQPDVATGLTTMRGYGFAEVSQIAGKLASAQVRSEYTDHLAGHGLLDTYRDFMRARAPQTQAGGTTSAEIEPMWNVSPSPLPAEHYIDTWVGKKATDWIASADRRRPFLLWVGFPGPRYPWDAPAEFVEQYRDAGIALDDGSQPDTPGNGPFKALVETALRLSGSGAATDKTIREVRRHYFANVTVIDVEIGRIVGALRRRELDGSTWIIYSSDHGEMLGSHGLFSNMVFYEPAVKVPLIIRPPGGGPGRRFADLIEQVDLSATLLDIAGARPLPGAPGRTLADVAEGSRATGRSVVVSENFGFGMWRTERYKLVVEERQQLPVQLFDLIEDPDEDHNLVSDPDYGDIVGDLMYDYVRRFLATNSFPPG
jgi:arylsulfatase